MSIEESTMQHLENILCCSLTWTNQEDFYVSDNQCEEVNDKEWMQWVIQFDMRWFPRPYENMIEFGNHVLAKNRLKVYEENCTTLLAPRRIMFQHSKRMKHIEKIDTHHAMIFFF